MKYLWLIALPIIMIVVLSGCASLTYKAPNGTEVTYSRLFTSSDIIKGKVGDATVESRGQQIDTAALQQLLSILLQVK